MPKEIVKIDKYGRIKLPEQIRQHFGLTPNSAVTIELTASGIIIRPQKITGSVTRRISKMNLPVAEWEEMEDETGEGRFCE